MRNKIHLHDVMQSPWPQRDNSVDCIVTSPPYWGLRDYGTGTWEGGDPTCTHAPRDTEQERGLASSTLQGGKKTTGHGQEGFKEACPRCGAVRIDKQLGLEAMPEDYVANVVAWSRECRRVLKPWGTFWLVIADTYWGGKGQSGGARTDLAHSDKTLYGKGQNFLVKGQKRPQDGRHPQIKNKDLVGIPWMVAFALRNDGWWLRNDIIWAKPNPMPESVADRCTKSHEHVFLFTKSDDYYYDAIAVEELANYDGRKKMTYDQSEKYAHVEAVPGTKAQSMSANGGDRWRLNAAGEPVRNKRDVWTVATKGFPEAHFATYPEELITPCILAGTSAHGNCADCGRPWERQEDEITWKRTCECATEEVVAPIVGDPFMGAGTTALTAMSHGRDFTGLELNPTNIEMAQKRLLNELGMFYTSRLYHE
jgi:DNA modification methylase